MLLLETKDLSFTDLGTPEKYEAEIHQISFSSGYKLTITEKSLKDIQRLIEGKK